MLRLCITHFMHSTIVVSKHSDIYFYLFQRISRFLIGELFINYTTSSNGIISNQFPLFKFNCNCVAVFVLGALMQFLAYQWYYSHVIFGVNYLCGVFYFLSIWMWLMLIKWAISYAWSHLSLNQIFGLLKKRFATFCVYMLGVELGIPIIKM